AAALELVEEQYDVGAAGQQLGAQLARLERAQVEQRLQQAELVACEAVLAQGSLQARRERVGAAHQLDQGVQGPHLAGLSPVVGSQANPPAFSDIIQS